jgi:hypothetical protein
MIFNSLSFFQTLHVYFFKFLLKILRGYVLKIWRKFQILSITDKSKTPN